MVLIPAIRCLIIITGHNLKVTCTQHGSYSADFGFKLAIPCFSGIGDASLSFMSFIIDVKAASRSSVAQCSEAVHSFVKSSVINPQDYSIMRNDKENGLDDSKR